MELPTRRRYYVMIKNNCPVTYLSGIQNLTKYFKLINLRNIKVPKVRELNFWRDDEDEDELDEQLVYSSYIFVNEKYLTILCKEHLSLIRTQVAVL